MSPGPTDTRTAFLIVDVQNDVVADAWERDTTVGRMTALLTRARAAGVPVVWVQHSDAELVRGSEGWEIVPELVPGSETVIHKASNDAFEGTELADVLSRLGVRRVVVVGAETENCIRCTVHGAFARGYDTTLVGDAHTTSDYQEYGFPLSPAQAIAFTNATWKNTKAHGKKAEVVDADQVVF
jgi:nicotinamidase-related amidase